MDQRLPNDDSRNGPPGGEGGEASGVVAGGQELKITYLKQVEDLFQDQREKYDALLIVIEDFKAQRINVTRAIAKVKELFKGHNDLVFGFNDFLPKGYEITVIDANEPPPRRPVGPIEAMSFVIKVKNLFGGGDQFYKTFLHTMRTFRKGDKSVMEVYQELAELFDEHVDLLDEFTRFLPEGSAALLMHDQSIST